MRRMVHLSLCYQTGGVIVMTTGLFMPKKDEKAKRFIQTFFLSKQGEHGEQRLGRPICAVYR